MCEEVRQAPAGRPHDTRGDRVRCPESPARAQRVVRRGSRRNEHGAESARGWGRDEPDSSGAVQ